MLCEEVFVVTQVKKNVYNVAKFGDNKRVTGDKEAISVSQVTISKDYYHCDCVGFRMQKDKSQHKHCLIVDFIIKNIDNCIGYCFWFENDTIKYNKFFDYEYVEKRYLA